MDNFFGFVATLSSGLFAGAAVYITFVEHPARMECGTALAVTEFGPSYRRAAVMQAPLATMGTLFGILAAVVGSSALWLLGGAMLGTVVPLTLIAIFPTNKRLLDPTLDRTSELARRLLERWGRLHAFRTVLGFASFALFVALLAS